MFAFFNKKDKSKQKVITIFLKMFRLLNALFFLFFFCLIHILTHPQIVLYFFFFFLNPCFFYERIQFLILRPTTHRYPKAQSVLGTGFYTLIILSYTLMKFEI